MDKFELSIGGIDRELLSTSSYDELAGFLDPNTIFSYDVESNAQRLYTEGYELVGFSVANSKHRGLYVCFKSLDYEMDPENRMLVDAYMKNVLTTKNFVVHNMQHERAAILTAYGVEVPYETMDDTLFMSRLLLGGHAGSGLKNQAQLHLSYPDWDTDLHIWMDCVQACLHKWIKNDIKILSLDDTDDDVDKMILLLNDYGYDDPWSIIQMVCDKGRAMYSTVNDIPGVLSYGLVPYKMICRYGAMDALATIELKGYYEEEMERLSDRPKLDLFKGYEVLRRQAYAGYILERNGAYWNDEFVREEEARCMKDAEDAIRAMLLNPLLEDFLADKAWGRYLPHVVAMNPSLGLLSGVVVSDLDPKTGKFNIKVNGKRAARGKLWDLIPKTPENIHLCVEMMRATIPVADMNELRDIYNPRSTTDNDRILKIFNDNEDYGYGRLIESLSELVASGEYNPEIVEYLDKMDIIKRTKCSDIHYLIKETNDIADKREPGWWKRAMASAGYACDRLLELQDVFQFNEEEITQLLDPSTYKIVNTPMFHKAVQVHIYGTMTDDDHDIIAMAQILFARSDKRKCPKDGKDLFQLFKGLIGPVNVSEYQVEIGTDRYGRPINETRYNAEVVNPHGIVMTERIVQAMVSKPDSLSRPIVAAFHRWSNEIGGDSDCPEEWDEYYQLLANFTKYAKVTKIMTTYINGDKIGRGTVCVVDKSDLHNGITTKHGRKYDWNKLNSNETTLMESKFSVATADTLRWQAGLHTLQWRSIPKKFYTSRYPGGTILCPDYSQNEVRCLASTSGCKALLEAFRNGEDPHMTTASLIFNRPKEQILPGDRRYAKMATFSILYGASTDAFARNYCNGDLARAEHIIGRFYSAYPEIKTWIDGVHAHCEAHGWVPTLTNALLRIDANNGHNKQMRDAQNYPIQSASSAIVGCVLSDICRWIESEGLKSKPFMFVHDSIEVDCHPHEFIKVVSRMGKMLNDIPVEEFNTPVHSELSLGLSLGHELECDIEVDGDPETATECTLTLTGLKHEIYETIENWRKAYSQIDILEEWHYERGEDGEWIKDEETGKKKKFEGYSTEYISWYDMLTSRIAYSRNCGEYMPTGYCKVFMRY